MFPVVAIWPKDFFTTASNVICLDGAADDVISLDEVADDGLLTVSEAARLPELRGHMTEKALRKAISDGSLPSERIGKLIFTTRASVQTWRNHCRAQSFSPAFSSSQPAGAKRLVSSPTRPHGSLPTETKRHELDVARAMMQELRQRLQPT